jgi:hypothetical protein
MLPMRRLLAYGSSETSALVLDLREIVGRCEANAREQFPQPACKRARWIDAVDDELSSPKVLRDASRQSVYITEGPKIICVYVNLIAICN